MKHLNIHGEDWVIFRNRGSTVECVNKQGDVKQIAKSDVYNLKVDDRSDIIIPNLPLFPDRPQSFLAQLRQTRVDFITKQRFDKFNKKRKPREPKEPKEPKTKRARSPRKPSVKVAINAAETQLNSLFAQLSGTDQALADTLKQALAGMNVEPVKVKRSRAKRLK